MKLSRLPVALAFAATLGIARAQAPHAEEARWREAINTFTAVLSGDEPRSELDKLLSDHSWVAPFARNRTESVAVLPSLLEGLRVVSARSYLHPSVTSATDLVADIQADESIDQAIRRKLVPPEGRDMHQADATMARWFSTALEAQPGDPVALVAMYDTGHAGSAAGPATPPSLTLLLIRGEFAADGSPRLSRLLYGTLEAAVR